MTYQEVWEQTEVKDRHLREDKAKAVLEQFYQTTWTATDFNQELATLLQRLFNENSKELPRLIERLEENDFGEPEWIRIALSNLKKPFTKDRKDKLERIPGIQQVKYHPVEEGFYLQTSVGSTLFAEDTTTYLKKIGRLDLISLIDPIYCTRNCHLVTYEAMQELEVEAHTARCITSFQKRVFHSYAYDKKRDLCLDFAHHFVLKRDDYAQIFQPDIFSTVTKNTVEFAYREATKEESVSTQFLNKLLVISLAKGKRKLGGKYGI